MFAREAKIKDRGIFAFIIEIEKMDADAMRLRREGISRKPKRRKGNIHIYTKRILQLQKNRAKFSN